MSSIVKIDEIIVPLSPSFPPSPPFSLLARPSHPSHPSCPFPLPVSPLTHLLDKKKFSSTTFLHYYFLFMEKNIFKLRFIYLFSFAPQVGMEKGGEDQRGGNMRFFLFLFTMGVGGNWEGGDLEKKKKTCQERCNK